MIQCLQCFWVKYKRILKFSLSCVCNIYAVCSIVFKTELMRLDLELFGSSGMERIVQKFVSEEINSRTDFSNENSLTECFRNFGCRKFLMTAYLFIKYLFII